MYTNYLTTHNYNKKRINKKDVGTGGSNSFHYDEYWLKTNSKLSPV